MRSGVDHTVLTANHTTLDNLGAIQIIESEVCYNDDKADCL